MKIKALLAAIVIAAIGYGIGSRLAARREPAPDLDLAKTRQVPLPAIPANLPREPAVQQEPTPLLEITAPQPSPRQVPATNAKPQRAAAPIEPGPRPKEEIKDPMARLALAFVGFDPEAEDYWLGAINDSNLSAHERQDLIEDLNEDGLPDPKHPGIEDLPVIVQRLQLIEEVAPYAMDKVNADAFAEAHKDLVNLLDELTWH